MRSNTPDKTDHQVGMFCYFHTLSSLTSVPTSEGGLRGGGIGHNRTMHHPSMSSAHYQTEERRPAVEEILDSESIASFLFHFDMDGECGECVTSPLDQWGHGKSHGCVDLFFVFILLLGRSPVRTEE